jgi:hypothetical protein
MRRLLVGRRSVSGVKICLLPAETARNEGVGEPSEAASRGGLVSAVAEDGTYRIPCVPSGRYEFLVILNAGRHTRGWRMRAPGAPWNIGGRYMALPDVVVESAELSGNR